MKDFDEIGKKMPYKESTQYINGLIETCANEAIASKSPNLNSRFVRKVVISTITAAAVFGGIWVTIPRESTQDRIMQKIEKSKSLDDVLSTLDNNQLAALNDYPTDDIPEY